MAEHESELKLTFIDHTLPPDINVFWADCDTLPLPPGHVNGPVLRDGYIIELCIGGRGVLQIDDKSFAIEQGQAFVIYPGVISVERADAEDPWCFSWVLLDGSSLESLFAQMGISRHNPVFPFPIGKNIYRHFRSLAALDERLDGAANLRRLSLTYELLADLLSSPSSEEYEIQATSSYANAAIRFIRANYYKKIKVADVANHLGLNRSYFFSLFKKSIGISPQDFLISFRMKKACEFLENPYATIADVAYSVGYDPTVFSQIFKKTIGVSPSYYRAHLVKSPEAQK